MPTSCEHGIGFEGVARLVSQGCRIALGRDVLVRHVKVQVVRQSHPVVGGLALEVPGAVDTHPVEEREDHLLWDQSGSEESLASKGHLCNHKGWGLHVDFILPLRVQHRPGHAQTDP